uniref:Large ribosomal subunit protein uL24c n=1 Tax=Porphyridium purpureum TaxID=35688 RepID=W0S1T4_PORPP|nr:chloroplast 50S ribosomal protein L24 [Porphyridium purpureum]ATJ02891.1 50S ribosomal protein L24 [Porphyridium purpureum]BAO23668.1 chloroplast 50S ribosomal protein L24 [Porphyridium purpureum]
MINNKKSLIYKIHVRVGDEVKIIAGKDKGKIGEVTKILKKKHQVIVKGVNLKIKHIKPARENESGQIQQNEFPIDSSNVMLYSQNNKVSSRIEYVFEEKTGRKIRRLKKNQEILK